MDKKLKVNLSVLGLLWIVPVLIGYGNDLEETWPAWRGPSGDGHAATSAKPPVQWNEEKNLRWKIALPGLGNSTPSVWEKQIVLTAAKPTGRKIEASGKDAPGKDASGQARPNEYHALMVVAYDLETGNEKWNTQVTEVVPHEKGHRTSSYASASTVTDGQRIYAFFGSHGLFALDMNGNKLWEREFPKMKTAAGFGEGASPALAGNVLVIPWDEEGQSFVAGIDTKSGEQLWRTDRETGSAWTTPLIVQDGDRKVAVVSGSAYTRAYDVKDGKEVWHCGGMSSNPTCSPVAAGEVVYVGNSFRGNVIQAIRFKEAEGDLSATKNLLWTHEKSASYVPSSVVVDKKLYFLRSSTGVMGCLDATTGAVIFPGKRLGLKSVHASPMVAADRIYVSSREGDTVVLDLKKECEVLATNHLEDVFDASPVAIGDSLILRGRKNLYRIQAATK